MPIDVPQKSERLSARDAEKPQPRRGKTIRVDALAGRVSAAMIVPYPPGIPVIMPGERFPSADSAPLRYLETSQTLDARFPRFATEIRGVHLEDDGTYLIPCLLAGASTTPAEQHGHVSTLADAVGV